MREGVMDGESRESTEEEDVTSGEREREREREESQRWIDWNDIDGAKQEAGFRDRVRHIESSDYQSKHTCIVTCHVAPTANGETTVNVEKCRWNSAAKTWQQQPETDNTGVKV